jgi:hypothetical protein
MIAGSPPGCANSARQLKPIIGAQAERIWMAYVAEDETGKTQIQDYLELLAAQHFRAAWRMTPGTRPSQGA